MLRRVTGGSHNTILARTRSFARSLALARRVGVRVRELGVPAHRAREKFNRARLNGTSSYDSLKGWTPTSGVYGKGINGSLGFKPFYDSTIGHLPRREYLVDFSGEIPPR